VATKSAWLRPIAVSLSRDEIRARYSNHQLFLSAGSVSAQKQPIIGLITKTETNPFFVKMREGAQAAANSSGARLLTGAGKADGDNAGQVTAIENMIAAGANAILITPNDSKAIVPAIRKARNRGVLVIALDSPTDPTDAVDALFATECPMCSRSPTASMSRAWAAAPPS
jgi:fructose transport system substrate-binding protein